MKIQRVPVIRMGVDLIGFDQALNKVIELAHRGAGFYVCVSNVHMCMEVFDSDDLKRVVDDADLVIADSRVIYAAQRILGHKSGGHVRGQDIMDALCARSARQNLRIGLYGGSDADVLERVEDSIRKQYPDASIVYRYAPPFRSLTPEEDRQVIDEINAARVNVLFVGIGCPKQEYWMAAHKGSLDCVMLGVGAAFDFISGAKKHAPRWMQKSGLEWVFRLCSEPKRLWKRYFKQNPRFIYHFFKGLFLKKRKVV
ncbi:N-acetylglucosaminyldiphosphoundecaprenol N-acetyl-beta-D-mannosaminyltransferase [Desulfobotulus alkaliphilus]|uniref:N-acetylglucosaminyldiphosphoundecaprenol N-acetyl-beta-D-mannosaminyltransferase n=1 Tax=Desulfobotulus alkaliphilus TaxID=622671 RepID=A0A562R2U2_9BACT|nr:WecB/TagA/CpsF family glycosyltransferase [Desulfobotulus alkaliphilus]TWI63379.1 N-acetylglucosaminyldiphosphoundecaprenol N-acetyl-beta-D-mannosaminyltransferase [Desulfobotulus alkaliphilus]